MHSGRQRLAESISLGLGGFRIRRRPVRRRWVGLASEGEEVDEPLLEHRVGRQVHEEVGGRVGGEKHLGDRTEDDLPHLQGVAAAFLDGELQLGPVGDELKVVDHLDGDADDEDGDDAEQGKDLPLFGSP